MCEAWEEIALCIAGIYAAAAICFAAFFLSREDMAEAARKAFGGSKVGRIFLALLAGFMAHYAATKQEGIWTRVSSDGADAEIGLVGVYTATTNNVTETDGIAITNPVHLVAVAWTSGTVDASTAVSYRSADTNKWTEVEKTDVVFSAQGTTNMMQMVTAEDLSKYRFWWVGDDKPAVVITDSYIEITSFVATSTYVDISWKCSDERAKTFIVQRKGESDTDYTTVATVSGNTFRYSGFTVDKTVTWRIVSEFSTEDDQ